MFCCSARSLGWIFEWMCSLVSKMNIGLITARDILHFLRARVIANGSTSTRVSSYFIQFRLEVPTKLRERFILWRSMFKLLFSIGSRRRPQCAPSQNIVRYREISLTALILFIPATAKPQISNETARIILLRSDLKYPLKAANFAVIYCFITPTQKGLPTTKTTHRSHGAQRCLFLTKPSKKLWTWENLYGPDPGRVKSA